MLADPPTPFFREQLDLFETDLVTLVCPRCYVSMVLERDWVAVRPGSNIGCSACGHVARLPALEE